jgi:hypothetical protein
VILQKQKTVKSGKKEEKGDKQLEKEDTGMEEQTSMVAWCRASCWKPEDGRTVLLEH